MRKRMTGSVFLFVFLFICATANATNITVSNWTNEADAIKAMNSWRGGYNYTMLEDFETQAALMPGIDDGVKNYSFGPATFEVTPTQVRAQWVLINRIQKLVSWRVIVSALAITDGYGLDNFGTVAPVPESSTIVLMGLGFVGIAGLGRKAYFYSD